MNRFLEANKISLAAAAAGSAGTAVNGALIDMAGFDGVLIFGTITTANAGNYLKAQQGDDSGGSDLQDLAGSKVVATTNGDLVALEIHRPKDRYVRGVFIRAGTNTATGDMYYIRYHAHEQAVVNNVTDEVATVALTGPAEGTP